MPKVKLQDQEMDGIGPLPDRPEDLMEGPGSRAGSSSQSTTTDNPPVSQAFAGDLIKLPFEVAHVLVPAIEPLGQDEVAKLAKPFANILTKHNLGGKIGSDELQFGFYLTVIIAARIQSYAKYRAFLKAQAELVEKNTADKDFEVQAGA